MLRQEWSSGALSHMSLSETNLLDVASILRPRLTLQDAILVIAIISAATLFAFEYDFFAYARMMSPEERRVTVQEYFALTGLLIVSLIGFSFYRLRQQRNEYQRRVAAEIAAREALHDAMHDPLTGLPNRRALLLAIRTALDDLPAMPRAHALLLLDLNGFKAVNDAHGHAAGDQLLRVIALRLHSTAGGTMAARLGGDEFAVWFADVPHRGAARALARRLVDSIEEPIVVADSPVQVGAGIGISFYPQDADNEAELFRCADAALYRAKAARRPYVEGERELPVPVRERRAHRD